MALPAAPDIGMQIADCRVSEIKPIKSKTTPWPMLAKWPWLKNNVKIVKSACKLQCTPHTPVLLQCTEFDSKKNNNTSAEW